MANGAEIVEAIVITGTYDNWPGAPRTLTRRRPAPRPRPTMGLIQFRGRVDFAAGLSLRRSNSAGLIWPSVE